MELVAKPIGSGLRLQCRRKDRVDSGLHGLLRLRVSEPSGLWPKTLETSLLRGHLLGKLRLLLLLDAELGLGSEPGGLGRQSILELVLSHVSRCLRLHLRLVRLLVHAHRILPRSCLRNSC